MISDLLMRFNLEIVTPEPWTQKDNDFSTSWGDRPLATSLSVHVHPKEGIYTSVYIGPFKGGADAEVFDEIPAALRRAYVQAMRSARGTESESQMFRDAARAPRWLRDGLRRALDAEIREAHLEVKRLDYAKGRAEHQHDRALASRALLPEEPRP